METNTHVKDCTKHVFLTSQSRALNYPCKPGLYYFTDFKDTSMFGVPEL